MNIRFFDRGGVIYARVSSGKRGESAKISTGLKSYGLFVEKTQSFLEQSKEIKGVEKEIERIKMKFRDMSSGGLGYKTICSSLLVENKKDDSGSLLSEIRKSASILISNGRRSKGTPYADGTIKCINTSMSSLTSFFSEKRISVSIKSIDMFSASTKEDRIAVKNKASRLFSEYLNWMDEKGYKPNTKKNYMSVLNTIIADIEERNCVSIPRAPVPSGGVFPIYTLDRDFVARFVRDDYGMYEKMPASLRWIYEVSVVILMTTLRLSDAMSIKPENLTVINGVNCLAVLSKKTKKIITIPIPDSLYNMLKSNIEKYGSVYTKSRELPQYQEAFQKNIRRLFSLYPETKGLTTVTSSDSSGNIEFKSVEILSTITAHTLRRTAITNMIAMGVPEEQVKWASGHSGDSKAFRRYVNFVQSSMNDGLVRYHKDMMVA